MKGENDLRLDQSNASLHNQIESRTKRYSKDRVNQGPVSRIVKYESFLIYDFRNLGTCLRRAIIAFLEALRK